MSDRYRTIESTGEGMLREKASRFLAFAMHASGESAAKELIASIAKGHHDSRHVCYAYVIGPGMDVQRAHDAGEPAGTAGAPILRAIQQQGLTNTVVVVVRYFGGTLLGKAGLIRAYGSAARSALDAATIREEVVRDPVAFICPLPRIDWLKTELRRLDGLLTDGSFGDDCRGIAWIPRERIKDAIANWRIHGIEVQRNQSK